MIDPSVLAPEKPRPLRRHEYERLAETGAFEDERVELLDGVVVTMSPQGVLHSYVTSRLNMILAPALVGRAVVRVQMPIAAADDSEPEPDLAVVGPNDDADGHPSRAALVVEVADSSLRKDRLVKAPIYAAAGVSEYWVVDLTAATVEVYRDPVDGRYRTLTTHGRGETLTLRDHPDVRIPLDEILPRAGR